MTAGHAEKIALHDEPLVGLVSVLVSQGIDTPFYNKGS